MTSTQIKRKVSVLICALGSILISTWIHAAPGDLDLSFSGDGKVTTGFGAGFTTATTALVQADGKIVAAGYHESPNDPTHADVVLVRYLSNGSLDLNFGSNGKVVTSFKQHDYAETLDAAISGNRIFVVGNFLANNSTHSIFIVCYRKDGSLDQAFDDDGIKIFSQPYQPAADAIAIQTDGKIVVAAYDHVDFDFHVVRFNENGVLDTNFGSNGVASLDFPGGNASATSVKIQRNGKIVIGGHINQNGTQYSALARYNIDGTLDTGFGNNGVTIFDQQALQEYCYDLAIQSDGKILLTGLLEGSGKDFLVARFNSNGILDNTFGIQGWLAVDFQNQTDSATRILVQNNGRIILSGWTLDALNASFAMVRLLPTGSLDTSFGINGLVPTDFSTGFDVPWGSALQPDEKIVLAGNKQGSVFAVARYLTN